MNPLNLADDAPWKKRYRVPLVAGTQMAGSNPSRGLAISNQSGVYQLYAWQTETGAMTQLTDAPAGVVFGGISPDGEHIYYLKDNQGDEIGHFVRVPFAGGEAEDITPDMPLYASHYIGQSLDGSTLGFTVANNNGFQMYIQKDGKTEMIYKSGRLSVGPMLSYDGDYALIATTERSQYNDMALLAFNIASYEREQVVRLLQEDQGDIRPVAFAPMPGDTRLLANSTATGYSRPVIWDVKTGDRTDLPLHDMTGDVRPWAWSPDGTKLLLCHYFQAKDQLYIYDLDLSTLTKLEHPEGSLSSAYFVPGTPGAGTDEIFVNWQDATHPSQVIALDATTGHKTRNVLEVGDVPASRPYRSVTFTSSGGAQIQAWVAVPEGDGPFPTILHTHGGPTAVMQNNFNAEAQAWLDHGFAWMSVNYRGSVTFGRAFQDAILGMLGHREVDDMAAAYQWLVDNGIAQPDSVLLTGGSYGGYLTLQGLGRRPDLWAGGMAVVAIADWGLMYEDQAETLRGYQRSLFGGTPDELPEQHRASSPISYVDHIKAPVLVIQGENDTRCPSRQMKVYEQRMKEAGKDIHIHWFDAGHGSRAMEQNIEHTELKLRFAYRVLG